MEKTTLLCGLVFSFAYLRGAMNLSFTTLGLKIPQGNYIENFLKGFVAGLVILSLLILSLLQLDVYILHPGRNITLASLSILITKALFTGLAVALIEETLFRGALFAGLMQRSNAVTAAIVISIVYAAAHFIDYPPPASPADINWLTAPAMFTTAYAGIFSTRILDAMIALFLLGILLSLIRIRSGHIILCIGLHAGLVAAIKLSRFFTQYVTASEYSFLVSVYDHRLGWLATSWLVLATVLYYGVCMRKKE